MTTTANIREGIPRSLPNNLDLLSSLEFRLVVDRLPNTTYFCQQVNLPSVSLNTITIPNPVLDKPVGGDKLNYDPLNVVFKVDEDFTNYIELLSWIEGLGTPETLLQYKQLAQNSPNSFGLHNGRVPVAAVFSDMRLMIMNTTKNVTKTFLFKEAIPTSISGLQFNLTSDNIQYIECDVTFEYLKFEVDT